MASTVTVTEQFASNGALHRSGTLNLGVYTTDGVAVTPGQFRLGRFSTGGVRVNPTGGYIAEYIAATGKIKVYRSGNGVPNVLITGGQAAGTALQILPETNAGVLGKTAATNRTIPGATFGLVAVPGTMEEVSNAVDLSAITFTYMATGPY